MARLEINEYDFRKFAHLFSDLTADYLESLPRLPTFPHELSGSETERTFDTELPLEGIGSASFNLLHDLVKMSRSSSPRFFGYVLGSGLPMGALGDFLASILNQNVTAWRSAPAAVTIEKTVIRWLAKAISCEGFRGNLTNGGSIANMMGLCMAREQHNPANEKGNQGGVVYCSVEAHMSIPKAAMLLGLGRSGIRRISVDQFFRMQIDELRLAIERDIQEGKKPIAVIASAGTVSTGSIDPISDIADICSQYGIWLHVDGAYGALAAMAIPEKFQGLSKADSISLDPHKWLYQPVGCGCLLFRDPIAARHAFAYSEDYARPLSPNITEGFAFFEESIELSRPFRALKVWLSLRYFGLRAFQESIQEDLRLAKILAAAIEDRVELELMAPVELSAVCFRYQCNCTNLDALNRAILDRVIEQGKVYISNATVNGQFALRVCIVNHRSTESDVLAVIDEVLSAANELYHIC